MQIWGAIVKGSIPNFLWLFLGTANKPAADDRGVHEGKPLTKELAMYPIEGFVYKEKGLQF